MPKFPAVFALLTLSAFAISAEESANSSPAEKPAPAKPAFVRTAARATATPTPAPTPKRKGFFERVFGGGRPKATPAPTPQVAKPSATPTPTPAPKIRKSRKPKPTAENAASAETSPAAKPEKPTPATPAPNKKSGHTKAPKVPANAVEPSASADPEVQEKFRFEQTKAKAIEDPAVRKLKAAADEATSDEDSRTGLRAYNRALFDKMRELDGSLKDRIDRMEGAMMKRLGE